jgi:hypothetical protein
MRPDVGKVEKNSKLTLLEYTECPAARGTLHSNRRRRQLYVTRSGESQVIAGLHAVERTTSTVTQEPMTVPPLSRIQFRFSNAPHIIPVVIMGLRER